MPKVRQPYDEPVSVPALGGRVVNPRQTVDIPAGMVPNFLAAGWQPADDATKKAAKAPTGDDIPAPAGQQEG